MVTAMAVLLATALGALAPQRASGVEPTGWDEQFSSTTYDPAWTVVPGQGNTMSLTGSALRYSLTASTHFDGYLNGNLWYYDGGNSYSPGASLLRPISGDYWQMEAKATFYMPFANGRGLGLRVYFGDGSTGTYYAGFTRFRDGPWDPTSVTQNSVWFQLQQKTGMAYINYPTTTAVEPTTYAPAGDTSTFWFRLRRAGSVLTAFYSGDGTTWQQAWTHDFGTALDGMVQKVAIVGHSWYVPAGSYADWDYVTVSPLDTTAPTVTLEQAVGQADPTRSQPIHFTASFSEPVTGFTASDVSLSGTAAEGASVAVTSLDGNAYDVAVSDLTTNGPVTASIPAGAVTDLVGNTSAASTSTDATVVFDTTGPVITTPTSPLVRDATSGAGSVVTWSASATDVVSGPMPVTCVPTSGSTFAIGDTTVQCSSVDAAGNTTYKHFVVSVRGTEEQVGLLRSDVLAARLPAASSVSLTSKLDRTLAYLEDGRTAQALVALDSFIDQVTSLSNNKKYSTVAAALLADAYRIRAVID